MKMIIHHLEDWDLFAKQLVSRLEPNSILALSGPLGAGKTTLVQAIARQLGANENPRSPTFSLVRSYKLPNASKFSSLIHVDAYRIESPSDVLTLGLDELAAESGSLLVVEWPENLGDSLQAMHKPIVQIRIEQDPGSHVRRVETTPS